MTSPLIFDRVSNVISETLTTEFADFLAEQLGLESIDIANLIKDYLRKSPYSREQSMIISKVTKQSNCTNKCSFIYMRGKNAGKKCGTIIRKGGELCSKHRKKI